MESGGIVTTSILIDLTDLNGAGTAGDIIGVDGGAVNCHIGQIKTAVNGTIIGGRLAGLEAPTGGDPDINLWSAPEATLAHDTAISASAGEAQLTDTGDVTVSSEVALTAWPAADQYLYLVSGIATDADYTAGRILITLYGYK